MRGRLAEWPWFSDTAHEDLISVLERLPQSATIGLFPRHHHLIAGLLLGNLLVFLFKILVGMTRLFGYCVWVNRKRHG